MTTQFFCLLLLSLVSVGYCGDTCLACLNSPLPNKCQFIRKCADTELCYLDGFITPLGSTEYEMGCRDELQCLPTSAVGKRSGNLTRNGRSEEKIEVCTECCHGQLCNSALCGEAGFKPQSQFTRGPMCYTCDQHSDIDSCNIIRECGRSEVCSLHRNTHTGLYDSRCMEKHVCSALLQALEHSTHSTSFVGKKRRVSDTVIIGTKCLLKCCDTDICNGDCTNEVATTNLPLPTHHVTKAVIVTATSPKVHTSKPTTHAPVLTSPNPCDTKPCQHGACSVYLYTYRCMCSDGFTGRNCEMKS